MRQGARPMTTSGSDSSTGVWCSMRSAVTSASDRPTSGPMTPRRWKQLSALGLA
ncbi:Uncharacterised protein [Mycobacteroides abscessus]|nr:Uncharacterised protein [Mycobacteroides abscessus]